MKFIKTTSGAWINPALVKKFDIIINTLTADEYWVQADGIIIHSVQIKTPAINYSELKALNNEQQANILRAEKEKRKCIARNEAQTYLDNLVAELNAQENCNERK